MVGCSMSLAFKRTMTTKPSTFVASLNWLFKNPTGQLLTLRSYTVCQICMYSVADMSNPIGPRGAYQRQNTLEKGVLAYDQTIRAWAVDTR